MSDQTVVQFGMRVDAFPSTAYRCVGGPADGQTMRLVDGDVLVIGRQPHGVNPGDPFIALTSPPSTVSTLRQLSTYRGEYVVCDGELRWTDEHRTEGGHVL